MTSSKRILENSSYRQLENLTWDRLLEGAGLLDVYPDAFQATAISKTQLCFSATATIKTVDPLSATAIIETVDPFSAIARLHGT